MWIISRILNIIIKSRSKLQTAIFNIYSEAMQKWFYELFALKLLILWTDWD